MSLFGSFYTGVSGLQTGQNALNTTAHNLSNVDTKGYTRQQVLQSTRNYTNISMDASGVSRPQIGIGTYYSKVRQTRDIFLDQKYRQESGRGAFFSAYSNGIEETETLLGELNGASFKESYDDLWVAIQTLANEPETAVGKGLLVNKAIVFLDRASSVYQGLCDYQDNLNLQIKKDVDKINSYAKQLKQLNNDIMRVEAGNVEAANDLRDQRNVILDELSKLGNISYGESYDGSVYVQLEGVDLVRHDMVNEIGMDVDDITGFYTPFWMQNAKVTVDAGGHKSYNIEAAKVFNTTLEITSATGVGSLKGKLITRGDRRANYTDMSDPAAYKKEIANSVVMNVQAQFDGLIHNVATKLNEIIAAAADPATGYLCEEDANGNSTGIPLQLFQKKATAGYDPAQAGNTGYDADGYRLEDPDAPETLYTISNLKINQALISQPTKLDLLKPDDSFDYELGTALKEAFEAKDYKLNPLVETPCNLISFYDNLVGQVAITGRTFRGMQQTQETELESLEFAREEIIGVSSDEELSNMIKFQNAYNAASRYINVVDEMLEHILNTLGA